MECNKEEAVRAKDIAMKKMHDKDFVGARKFAQKAQQLYPEIDNITQLICVCDVHCSSENNMIGNEMDWYGILQVEQSADDTLIKKQYRKFALLLHPDKNKFVGAESAFKLIGEAQRVLLDKEKRSFHDMRRRSFYRPVIPPQQANKNSGPLKQTTTQNNFTGNLYSRVKVSNPPPREEQRQTSQSGAANGKETFWTLCPFCSVRYQYYKEVLSKSLRCQSCKKPFVAYDLHAQGVRHGSSATTQPVFPQQDIPSAGASKVGADTMNNKPASSSGFQSGKAAESGRSQQSARQPQNGLSKMDRQREWGSRSSRKVNGQRSKNLTESSESFESDSSSDSEEAEMHDGDMLRTQAGSDGDHRTRQSNRNKRRVSYNENASDNEYTATTSKKAKADTSSCPVPEEKPPAADISGSAFVKESGKGENDADGNETVAGSTGKIFETDNGFDSSPETSPDPTFHEYPDPEFFDFEKNRKEECFKPGQLWAAYDTADAMPRFYARINKISAGFKLKITWLESDPDDEDGKQWAESDLPVACGKFMRGETEDTTDRLMFSHEVTSCKRAGRGSFVIYPRKGEIWALFKNWSMKWCLLPEGERKFEYEFFEVLSDYDGSVGIQVAPLVKLKGFASLFLRKNINEIWIQPSELLRFSHMVPSCRMSGTERVDVPKGSFELDPASISINLEEITLSDEDKGCVYNSSSKFVKENPAVNMFGNSVSTYCDKQKCSEMECGKKCNGDLGGLEIPVSEFHRFDSMKSIDKFQVNQVWALYSDVDGLPTYYALVKKIDPAPDFKLHIVWLVMCGPADMILWKDKTMPISCGEFKIMGNKVQIYRDTVSFSHRLNAEPTFGENMIAVYPRAGEVWALHQNWNADMKLSDLQTCDYDIVEVQEENHLHTVVLILERVSGSISVFKPLKNGIFIVTKKISRTQLCRFSHQIPCFRLNNERGGSLKGFWELDPAALPVHFWQRRR